MEPLYISREISCEFYNRVEKFIKKPQKMAYVEKDYWKWGEIS